MTKRAYFRSREEGTITEEDRGPFLVPLAGVNTGEEASREGGEDGVQKMGFAFFARPKSAEAPRAGAVKKGEEEKRERERKRKSISFLWVPLFFFFSVLRSIAFSFFRDMSHAQTFRG